MNSRMKRFLQSKGMGIRSFLLVAFTLAGLCVAGWLVAEGQSPPDFVVHEWGTFTAIAGRDGQTVEWTPQTGSTDLPGFVERFGNVSFKQGLRGTIRMETPVIYFYSPQDATVSVRVAFAKGIITEWYPRAVRVEPNAVLHDASLRRMETSGSIEWSDIAVSPNLVAEFPHESRENRYYTARETASSPLRVKTRTGYQDEKFLFYRGVSASRLPLSAQLDSDGKLLVRNLGQAEIPAIILFERRGEKVGYRPAGVLSDETILDPPELTTSVDDLSAELEGILVERGLYLDEARAMVATWQDSWFEEGSRLIYVVPSGFIDNVLALAINPVPAQIVRVFIGRLEIVTPATERAVEAALASNDEATLDKYGRFLEPILQRLREDHAESAHDNRKGP